MNRRAFLQRLTVAAIAVPLVGLVPSTADAEIRAKVKAFVRALRTPGVFGQNEKLADRPAREAMFARWDK